MTHFFVAAAVLFMAVAASGADATWDATLQQRVLLYGHRNWIVIADSAYPAQSRDGIETVVSLAEHFDVLEKVLAAVDTSNHVRPIVYVDKELRFVKEEDAPGVTAVRERLSRVLKGRPVTSLPHEQIISKLDEAGKTFRVLIIKTNLTVPYTSVFLQLDCGYWSAEAEQKLRQDMKQAGAQ